MARASTGLGGMGGSLAFFAVAPILYGFLLLATLLGGTRHLAARLGVLGGCLAILVVFLSGRPGPDLTLVTLIAPVIGTAVLFALLGAGTESDG
jgi:hypothetical protein